MTRPLAPARSATQCNRPPRRRQQESAAVHKRLININHPLEEARPPALEGVALSKIIHSLKPVELFGKLSVHEQ